MKSVLVHDKFFTQYLILSVLLLFISGCNNSDDDTMDNNKAQANETTFSVLLNSKQSTSDTSSEATGNASLTVDTDSGDLSGNIEIKDLSGTNTVNAIHLHAGFPGQSGQAVITLEQDSADDSKWNIPENSTLSATQLDSFLIGGMYLNVHTSDVASGEIRGQVLPADYEVLVTDLSADQQVPSKTNSTLKATAYTLVNTTNGKIETRLHLSDAMDVTAIHIHNAMAGTNGGVVSALEVDANDASVYLASFNLSNDDKTAYAEGALYFNLHTNTNAAGELRGQLLPDDLMLTQVTLSGDQQTPNPVTSSGSAMAFITLNTNTGSYHANIRYADLTDVTAAHIHQAFAGSSGGVVNTLEMSSSEMDLLEISSTFDADQIMAFKQGELYFNLHTSTNAAGELRGQIIPENIALTRSTLDSTQVVDSVDSDATGIAYSTVNLNTGAIVSNLQLFDISDVSAIHIHEGAAGSSGGVALTLSSTDTDVWGVSDTLSTTQLAKFEAGELYYNVHTAAFAAGEIRGQITP